ncbi:MAG: hypothetical protein AAF982_13065 [Pseudomonadota bacterium]
MLTRAAPWIIREIVVAVGEARSVSPKTDGFPKGGTGYATADESRKLRPNIVISLPGRGMKRCAWPAD